MLLRLTSFLGLVSMVALAWAMSENRRKVDWRLVVWGVALQFIIGAVVLNTRLTTSIFQWADKAVSVLTESTLEGCKVVFGDLASPAKSGVILAAQALPVIIFVSALSAILYHLRVIQAVVYGIAWVMRRTLRTSGAETLSAVLQIFFGIESVTALRGYLSKMTRSELCTVMTTFMATIAGSVMVVYASPAVGASAGHLLVASLMAAPAAILVSKLLVPETEQPETSGVTRVHVPVESHNVIDAAARGTADGLQLTLNVIAMLIVFVGLVYLLNLALKSAVGYSFEQVTGVLFCPVAFLMGVPVRDAAGVGQLLGTKTVLNEFLAYVQMKGMAASLSPRSVTIATYALCGFSNPGSLGILIAGMSSLIPERRVEITRLGLKSFIAGTLSNLITACVAGVLIYE